MANNTPLLFGAGMAGAAISRATNFIGVGGNATQAGAAVVNETIAQVQQIAQAAQARVAALGSALLGGLSSVVSSVASTFMSTLMNTLGAVVGRVRDLIVQGMSALFGVVRGAIGGAIGLLQAGGAGLLSTVRGALATAVGAVRTVWDTITGAIRAVGSAVWNGLKAVVRAVMPMITEALEALVEAVPEAIPVLIAGALGAIVTLGGLLFKPFMAALSLVSRVVSAGASAAGAAISTVWNWMGQGAMWLGGVVRGAIARVAGWISSAWDWVSGAVSQVVHFVTTNFGPAVSALSSMTSQLLAFGMALGQIAGLGVVISAAAVAISKAAQMAMGAAQSAQTFGAMTGLGSGKSYSLMNRFGSIGLDSDAVTGALGGQNPAIFGIKAGIYGLPSYTDPSFMAKLAGRFQEMNASGPIGNIMAMSMMRNLGTSSPEWLRAASLSPGEIRGNQAYGDKINSQLGLTPSQLQQYATTVPLALDRIGTAFRAITMKLAGEALPIIENVLGTISSLVGQNAGKIGGMIEGAVRWLFVDAPILFMDAVVTVAKGIQGAVSAVVGWGVWLVQSLPLVLEMGTHAIAETLRGWTDSFGIWAPKMIDAFAGTLSGIGKTVAGWMDALGNYLISMSTDPNNPLRAMAMWFAGALDGMVAGVRTFVGNMAGALAALQDALPSWLKAMLHISVIPVDPRQAYADAVKNIGQTNAVGAATQFFNDPTKLPAWGNAVKRKGAEFTSAMDDLSNQASAAGLKVVKRIQKGGYGLADAMDPKNGPNVGRRLGDAVASAVLPSLNFLKNKIEPGVDSLAEAAQGYRGRLGSREERGERFDSAKDKQDKMIDLLQQQVDATKELVRDGKPLSNQSTQVVGAILAAVGVAQGNAILAQG